MSKLTFIFRLLSFDWSKKQLAVSTTTNIFESMWAVIHVTWLHPEFLYGSMSRLHDSHATFCPVIRNLGVVLYSLHWQISIRGLCFNREECLTSLCGRQTTLLSQKHTREQTQKYKPPQVVCETRTSCYFAGIWWIVSPFASNSCSTDIAYLRFLEWEFLEIIKCS